MWSDAARQAAAEARRAQARSIRQNRNARRKLGDVVIGHLALSPKAFNKLRGTNFFQLRRRNRELI